MNNVLDMHGIDKKFGPVVALDSVNFSVEHGEIHALLGVNGAGKSTLIKILSGIYTADNGSISIDGKPCLIGSPLDAISYGIASVQQHPELVGDFTGYENIFLGQEASKKGFFRRVDHKSMRAKAAKLLERFPVKIDLEAKIESLPSVEREIIAILHALKQENVKILILDEPTSTLTTIEKVQLFKMMTLLKQSGVSIIYITHRLEEVFEIADRFTVFRSGKNVKTMRCSDAQNDSVSIARIMLQTDLGDLFPKKNRQLESKSASLELRNLCIAGTFENISFQAHAGEIVGIYGLVGSGIDALAKTLFGALQPTSGEVLLKGKPATPQTPKEALKSGIFLVPGDRRSEGLVLNDNVTFNTTLANLGRASFIGVRRFFTNKKEVGTLAGDVALTPPILDRTASVFSGGNQQKIVIAKGLYSQSDVYIFVEPTVGVDVGARATLYSLIRKLSTKAAVIIMSSDNDEIFGLSDKMGAIYRGQMTVAPSATITRDELLAGGIAGNTV